MVTRQKPLRPLSLGRGVHRSIPADTLPTVPDGIPERLVAPDRRGPTEGNGTDVPRAELHIALVIPDKKQLWDYIQQHVFVIQPPYWTGTVKLHVITNDPRSKWSTVDWTIRQALVDSGLADADQVDFDRDVEMTFGWPLAEPE